MLILWFLLCWLFALLILWFFGSLDLWIFGSLVLWFFGSLVLGFVFGFLGSWVHFWVIWFFDVFNWKILELISIPLQKQNHNTTSLQSILSFFHFCFSFFSRSHWFFLPDIEKYLISFLVWPLPSHVSVCKSCFETASLIGHLSNYKWFTMKPCILWLCGVISNS